MQHGKSLNEQMICYYSVIVTVYLFVCLRLDSACALSAGQLSTVVDNDAGISLHPMPIHKSQKTEAHKQSILSYHCPPNPSKCCVVVVLFSRMLLFLAERCNYIAKLRFCHKMLSVCLSLCLSLYLSVVCEASVM